MEVVEIEEPVVLRPHVVASLPGQILLPEVVNETQDAFDAPAVRVLEGHYRSNS